jgi:hypothetical protein
MESSNNIQDTQNEFDTDPNKMVTEQSNTEQSNTNTQNQPEGENEDDDYINDEEMIKIAEV